MKLQPTTDPNATADVTDASDITSDVAADRTTTILVTAEDGTTKLTYTVQFNPIVSVEGHLAGNLQVYPNPASEYLQVESIDRMSKLKIINILGEVVMEKNVESDKVEMNISSLMPASYIISIQTVNNEVYHTYFMKK